MKKSGEEGRYILVSVTDSSSYVTELDYWIPCDELVTVPFTWRGEDRLAVCREHPSGLELVAVGYSTETVDTLPIDWERS